MSLPEIKEIITIDRALELCRHFQLEYHVARMEGVDG